MLRKIISSVFFLMLAFPSLSMAFGTGISVHREDGIYTIKLPKTRKTAKHLSFAVTDDLMTVREFHKKTRSLLTVNGGFFDPKNKKTVSYVVSDGHTSADPIFNENLFADPLLKRNMDKILNRSEFRVLECFEGYEFEIVQHKSPVDFQCHLLNSIQGGPLVYPKLQLEEEFFIMRDENGAIIRESASVLHRVARTIVALKDKEIYIILFGDEHPVTLQEVSEYCEEKGFDRAMALDGGGSTSMNYLDKMEVVSKPENGQGRMVKSFLIYRK